MGVLEYHPCGPGNWPTSSPHRSVNRLRPLHRGTDKPLFKRPQFASISGRATRGDQIGGAGFWVNIDRPDGQVTTKSFHLSQINITWGEIVKAGQQIGISGGVPGEPGAGNTTGAHVHYEVWVRGIDINPDPELELVEGIVTVGSDPVPVTKPPTVDGAAEPIKWLEFIMSGCLFKVDSGPVVQIVDSFEPQVRLMDNPDEMALYTLTLSTVPHPFAGEKNYIHLDWNNTQHRAACNAYYDLGYMNSLPEEKWHDDRPAGWDRE
jgi:hypothetical protein